MISRYIRRYIMGDNLFQDYSYSQIELKAIEGNAQRIYDWEQTFPKGELLFVITEYESGYRKYWYSLFNSFVGEMDKAYAYGEMQHYYNYKNKYFKYLKPNQKKEIEKYESEL